MDASLTVTLSAQAEAYVALVPATDQHNNDLASATVLPPTAKVPLATFVSWNLRAPETGAENSLARLAGGYIPFAKTADDAADAGDPRSSLEALYGSFSDYLAQYEVATDALITDGFLLSGFKDAYMQSHATMLRFSLGQVSVALVTIGRAFRDWVACLSRRSALFLRSMRILSGS